VQFLNMIPV